MDEVAPFHHCPRHIVSEGNIPDLSDKRIELFADPMKSQLSIALERIDAVDK